MARRRRNPKTVVWNVDPMSDSCAVFVDAHFASHSAARTAADQLGSVEGSRVAVDGNYAYCMVGPYWDDCTDDGMTEAETDEYQLAIFKSVCKEIEDAGYDWQEV